MGSRLPFSVGLIYLLAVSSSFGQQEPDFQIRQPVAPAVPGQPPANEAMVGVLRWVFDEAQGDEVLIFYNERGEVFTPRVPERLRREISMHVDDRVRLHGYRGNNSEYHVRGIRALDGQAVSQVAQNSLRQAPPAQVARIAPRINAGVMAAPPPPVDPRIQASAEQIRAQTRALEEANRRQNELAQRLLQRDQRQEQERQRQEEDRRRKEAAERLPKLHDEWLKYKEDVEAKEEVAELDKRRSGRAIQPAYPLYLKSGGLGTSNPYGAGDAETWSCKWGHGHEIPLRFKEVVR